MLPQYRRSDMHIEQVGDELVICDQRTQTAHCLNAGAAFVWKHCDGRQTAAWIADEARRAGISLDEAAVDDAIALLYEKDLLVASATASLHEPKRLSRRVLTKAAVAALVPAIVSIAAPSAVLAQSGPIRDGGNGGPIDGPPIDSF
ncbi:MAG: PqqD family protein [Planctomycetaceae bacterium]|nr:PqqD family protein [Planctomycetaceae bacterium]